MSLAEDAFMRLYPDQDFDYDADISYSGRFNDYNANVRLYGKRLDFGLSRKWKHVSDEIKIGLLQELMMDLFGGKKNTTNTDLYNRFVKNLHIAVEKNDADPRLVDSFRRVNERYFDGLVERPNLRFGSYSRRVFGNYNFHNDTITFSRVLESDSELLDYVMYHELLHKKLKFKHSNGRSYHHTGEFRKFEKQFKNWHEMEARLKRVR